MKFTETIARKIKQSLQPKSLRKTCKIFLFYGTLFGLFRVFYYFPEEPFSHTISLHIFNGDAAISGEYISDKVTILVVIPLFILCLYAFFFLLLAKKRKFSYIKTTFNITHVIAIFCLGWFVFGKARQYLNLVGINTYYEVERTVISKKQTSKSHNGGGFRGAGGGIETDYDIEYPTTHSKKGYKRITIWKGDWEKIEEGDSLLIYYYRGHFNGVTQVTLKKD
ncbi:hypothetical protein AAG747_25355 [Rapidithrix thailandica]|uniref:DUF3592 domain-containing protein n=1 Tax=Rapidithrix thailandica TaxID=413964 RepID=A0AAW9SHI8_9BACT